IVLPPDEPSLAFAVPVPQQIESSPHSYGEDVSGRGERLGTNAISGTLTDHFGGEKTTVIADAQWFGLLENPHSSSNRFTSRSAYWGTTTNYFSTDDVGRFKADALGAYAPGSPLTGLSAGSTESSEPQTP